MGWGGALRLQDTAKSPGFSPAISKLLYDGPGVMLANRLAKREPSRAACSYLLKLYKSMLVSIRPKSKPMRNTDAMANSAVAIPRSFPEIEFGAGTEELLLRALQSSS